MAGSNSHDASEPEELLEPWYRDVLNGISNGIVVAKAIRGKKNEIIDFQIQLANSAGIKMANLPDDCIGKNLFQLFPGLVDTGYFDRHKNVVETGIAHSEFVSFVHGNQERWFQLGISKMGDGIISNFSDVSEIKQQERTIDKQARLLTLMLNSSLNGVYTLDAVRDDQNVVIDFNLSHVNEVFCRMSGRTKESLVGKSFIASFPDTVRSGVFARNCEILKTGNSVKEEFHYIGDGVDRWYETSVNKVTDWQLVIAFKDITALRHAVTQLEFSNQQLQRSNERLSAFTQIASHDLSEPARKIIMYSDLLASKHSHELSVEVKELMSKVSSTGQRMKVLIADLLTYSQISNSPEKTEPVSLNAIISEVLVDLETMLIETKARVLVGKLPEINGGKTQLSQVFLNLISNGIKFQKKGGEPLLHLNEEESIHRDGISYYCISVKDNGIGFEEVYADKIFEAFQRLHSQNIYKGTGIGLAIVQKAMENHAGFVSVESQLGVGSTFYLHFPK